MLGRRVKIDVFDMGLEFLDLCLGNIESQLSFRFGQSNPEASPG